VPAAGEEPDSTSPGGSSPSLSGTFATPLVDDMIDKGVLELSVAESDAIAARLRSVF
jgi:hypothetical protein